MTFTPRIKAIMALALSGILGGVAPLFMKIALKEFEPVQIIFIRFGIAFILILPIVFSVLRVITLNQFKDGIIAGIFFTGNIFFIIVGLQYTTSIVSQLFYLLTPLFVSLAHFILFREKISIRRVISMAICFGGAAFLILQSIKGSSLLQSIGTIQGNVLILCAVLSWSSYVVYTKKIGESYSPTFFLVFGFTTSLVVSLCVLLIGKVSLLRTLVQFWTASPGVMASLIILGIVNSVLFFFLYQWSLKRVSAFMVASTTYLAPLSAATFAIPFFGEKLSFPLLVAAFSIFVGSYLILTEKK